MFDCLSVVGKVPLFLQVPNYPVGNDFYQVLNLFIRGHFNFEELWPLWGIVISTFQQTVVCIARSFGTFRETIKEKIKARAPGFIRKMCGYGRCR